MKTVQKMVLPAIIVVAVVGVGLVLAKGSGRQQTQAPVPTETQDALSGAHPQGIVWLQSLSEAQAEAKRRKTLIVVDAYADWCHWCKKMDEDTFTNPQVQHRMKDFVPLRLDTDAHPDLAQRYGITGLPTTLVLDAAGKVKLNQSGYLPPQDYLQLLNEAATTRSN